MLFNKGVLIGGIYLSFTTPPLDVYHTKECLIKTLLIKNLMRKT